jgi:hypothetical protein
MLKRVVKLQFDEAMHADFAERHDVAGWLSSALRGIVAAVALFA